MQILFCAVFFPFLGSRVLPEEFLLSHSFSSSPFRDEDALHKRDVSSVREYRSAAGSRYFFRRRTNYFRPSSAKMNLSTSECRQFLPAGEVVIYGAFERSFRGETQNTKAPANRTHLLIFWGNKGECFAVWFRFLWFPAKFFFFLVVQTYFSSLEGLKWWNLVDRICIDCNGLSTVNIQYYARFFLLRSSSASRYLLLYFDVTITGDDAWFQNFRIFSSQFMFFVFTENTGSLNRSRARSTHA